MAFGGRLRGREEVREAVVDAFGPWEHGRKRQSRALVAVAVEHAGQGMGRMRRGRMRLRSIGRDSPAKLMRFIVEAVEAGSVVRTDIWHGYAGLQGKGYRHEVTAAARLKRWLQETHPAGVRRKDLDVCLEEFAFRYRGSRRQSRGRLFRQLLEQAVATAPAPYRSLFRSRGRPAVMLQ